MTNRNSENQYLDEYLTTCWESFIQSDHPEYLAKYIERGGEIGDEPRLREYLAKILREYAPKPRGNSDRIRDIDVYEQIQWSLINNGQGQELPPLERAFEQLADDRPEVDIDTLRKQYSRGRKIMSDAQKE